MHESLSKRKIRKGRVFNVEILIRQEAGADFDSVYEVVKEAFLNAEYTNHDEQNLVVRLRNSVAFVPDEVFMANELAANALSDTKGVVEYPKEFITDI